jgi:hypothetical protein
MQLRRVIFASEIINAPALAAFALVLQRGHWLDGDAHPVRDAVIRSVS